MVVGGCVCVCMSVCFLLHELVSAIFLFSRDALRLSSLVVLNAAEDSAVFPMDQEVASDTSSDDEYNQ